MEEEDIYNLLRKDIINKLGKEILYGKDCVHLANQIYKHTRRQISSSTLKRFFGFLKTRFNPSKYTLETLVIFLGFKDWNDYLNCYDESKYNVADRNPWDFLKNRIQLVSKQSLDSLKQKTSYDPEKTILRSFAREKFEKFDVSEKTATMFVAPEGYGKSTLLIQLVEKYFMNDDARYHNDIMALIDGGIFFNLYARNSNIELLNQLLEFKISSSVGHFFQKNPKHRKGRVWMIIDNVDEIFFDQDSYHHLVENIMRIIMVNESGWFKLMLTCRPENLDIFSYLVHKNPILKESWFEVNFSDDNMTSLTNIPHFNKKEIETIISKYDFECDYDYLNTYHQEVAGIICHPYLCWLFANEYQQNRNISEILLLNRYINQKLYSAPFRQEKIQLIKAFTDLTQLGKKSDSVRKEQLLFRANYLSAYRQLISYGIIYEYHIPNQMAANNTFVAFNQNTVFEFILFEKWRNSYSLTSELFFKIRDYYQNKLQLQCNLLKYFIRFLILEKDVETIKKIHIQLEDTIELNSTEDIPPCLRSVSGVIKQTIHTNTQFRKNIAPWLTRSKFGTILYSGEI